MIVIIFADQDMGCVRVMMYSCGSKATIMRGMPPGRRRAVE
jgi:hypothetical protein